jgi:hypothetical protein
MTITFLMDCLHTRTQLLFEQHLYLDVIELDMDSYMTITFTYQWRLPSRFISWILLEFLTWLFKHDICFLRWPCNSMSNYWIWLNLSQLRYIFTDLIHTCTWTYNFRLNMFCLLKAYYASEMILFYFSKVVLILVCF